MSTLRHAGPARVSFPVVDGRRTLATPPEISVLLVEDNPGDAGLVRAMLADVSSNRFVIHHVTRLKDAVEAVKRAGYDVLLCDLSLPDAHGVSAVKTLQSTSKSLPIVVLSGLADDAAALEALQCGAQDYLVKGQGDGNLVARAIRYSIERKRTEERLAHLAHYDQLTGLANRVLFQERLGQALARARRSGSRIAVLFLDLDRFKSINDTLGHDVGDRLLQAVADRLRGCVRESDTVARFGGDEFTIVLEGSDSRRASATVAEKVLSSLRDPFDVSGHEIAVTPSIGVAEFPECGEDASALTKHADAAMYQAKELGRDNYQFYTASMNTVAVERMRMESCLRRALARRELYLQYQPQFDMESRRIKGVEALLRWRSPEFGEVPPGQFIPVAEEVGLVVSIGEWVLREACVQNRAWQAAGLPAVGMSVNLSARQFRRENFARLVTDVLATTGLEPRFLSLEITESVLIEEANPAHTTLRELHDAGVRISLDDFGTGYSSLSYLKRFPVDEVKIDRSFVRDITVDADDAAIVNAVIALAHILRLEVVAEGVETEEQLEFLRVHGCEMAQGYLFSPPVSPDTLADMLREQTT